MDENGTEYIHIDQSVIDRSLDSTTLSDFFEQADYTYTITLDERERYDSWIKELPSRYKKIYQLVFIDKLKQKEVEQCLGLSQSGVSRATQRLIEYIKALNYPREDWRCVANVHILSEPQARICYYFRKHMNYLEISKTYNKEHGTSHTSNYIVSQLNKAMKALTLFPAHKAEMQHIKDNFRILSSK